MNLSDANNAYGTAERMLSCHYNARTGGLPCQPTYHGMI